MTNEMELMNIQAEVLYIHDSRKRLSAINEHAASGPVPRLFWGETRRGSVLRFRHDVPDAVAEEIVRILNGTEVAMKIPEMIRVLDKLEKVSRLWLGPAYVFDAQIGNSGRAVEVTEFNRSCLEAGFGSLLTELDYKQPCYAIIENNIAVSVCFSARQTARAAEAGVETLKEFRGRGYAAEAAAAWAEGIRAAGRIPLYSTSWDNYASQSIANRLELTQYGTDVSIY